MPKNGRHPKSHSDGAIAEDLYRSLRQAIIGGRLRPGERLVETQVAQRWGVSKSPGREALKWLEQEGLVQAIPRRGYVVTPVTVKQIQDLFDLRLILERETAARAARVATREQVEQIRRLVGVPYVPGDPQSYTRFVIDNKKFHMEIAKLGGNQRLLDVLDRLLDDLERLFHLGLDIRDRSTALVQEHEELLAAIERQNPKEAGTLATSQIERTRQTVLEAIMRGALGVQVG